jgi:hypothetical protein
MGNYEEDEHDEWFEIMSEPEDDDEFQPEDDDS